MAENIDITTPMKSVCAKLFIGPVPKKNSIAAAIKVVILQSISAGRALEKPDSIDVLKVLPAFNSSFILSKIITFASTAIPIVSIIPAMPGSERETLKMLKSNNSAIIKKIRAILAAIPENL
jgi:hypothetical protein